MENRFLQILFKEKDIVKDRLSIEYWRQMFYISILIFSGIFGLIMSVSGCIMRLIHGMYFGAAINMLIYIIMMLFMGSKHISFAIRKSLMVTMYYILGLILLMYIGPQSAWNIVILLSFVIAGFLLSTDEIKLYGAYNVIIFLSLSLLLRMGHLDVFSIRDYGVSWAINVIAVQGIGFLLVVLIYRILNGIKGQSMVIMKKERDLRGTLNAFGDGVIVTDHIGHIVHCNPYMKEHYDVEEGDWIGKHINELLNAGTDEKEQHVDILSYTDDNMDEDITFFIKASSDQLESYIYAGQSEDETIPISDRSWVRRHSESRFLVTCKITEILDESNENRGYVCLIHDVTKSRMEEEQVRQAQKMEAIGTMAGGVAHDFNNMLGGILGYAELSGALIDNKKSKSYSYNQEIIKTAVKASELTKQLLAYARKKEMKREAIDIFSSVRVIVDLMERTFEKKVEIELTCKDKGMTVFGDASLIENALLNMGLNGRDAMTGGGVLKICLSKVYLDHSYCETSEFDISEGMYVDIKISDNGIGMSQEVIDRVFEPFFTTKEIGKGTGLGLSATYGTVVSHHGAIAIASEKGVGTVIDMYLPLCQMKISNNAPLDKKEPLLTKYSGRLLVIDDEEVIRTILKEILEMLGYEVVIAQTGMEGINLFKEAPESYQGVFVDMIMPKFSGKDVFLKIKEIHPPIKVIMISGFLDENNLDGLYELGLDGFVMKPFTINSIEEALSVL